MPTDNRNTAWYPSRLIDLGSIDSQSGSIKLVDTARVKPEGNYITLSHCWGGGTPVKLKSENLSDFFLEIRSLPKTFEHAVEATRKLGVRYLWIDSLCIVQDDPSDWMREAALMHKVYRHAWCNLSATAARNSNAGLFWNRGGNTLVGPLVVDVGEPKRTLLLEADLFTAAIEHSPLQDVSESN